MPDLEGSKHQLREAMEERRRRLPAAEAEAAARTVSEHLQADSAFRAARRVAVYAALPGELPTRPLFEAVTASGRPCLFPRTRDDYCLEFALVQGWDELRPGAYRVPEPPASAPSIALAEGDLVVVPGLAFDARGQRLGHGRGCYDRTFPGDAASPPLLFGLGFGFQLVDRVPHGSRDRRMDAIVTERGVHWVAGA